MVVLPPGVNLGDFVRQCLPPGVSLGDLWAYALSCSVGTCATWTILLIFKDVKTTVIQYREHSTHSLAQATKGKGQWWGRMIVREGRKRTSLSLFVLLLVVNNSILNIDQLNTLPRCINKQSCFRFCVCCCFRLRLHLVRSDRKTGLFLNSFL